MEKGERLINLTALLMATRRPLSSAQIREAIYPAESEVAYRRKFERDKAELRELGLPVEVVEGAWEGDEGYRIHRDEATLPDLDLTPDEHAAIWLAASAWRSDDPATRRALLKIAASSGRSPEDTGPVPWHVEASSPHLAVLLDAIAERRCVRFAYRTGGGGEPAGRRVEPHALSYRGGWYLAGHDRDRDAIRHFKLSRIEGAVAAEPGDARQFERPETAGAPVPRGPWEGDVTGSATIAFSPSAAWWVERYARATREREREDGWVELAIPVADRDTFLSWVAGFADEAEVLSPPDLRDRIIQRLRRAAEAG